MTSEVTEVMVESVHVHADSAQHVVLLRERHRERYLPIWIGPWEASAIASRLQGMLPERPLTHDLYTRTLVELGARVRRVVVTRPRRRHLSGAHRAATWAATEYEIDARPSDAIAIALRADVPIFVADAVLDRVGVLPGAEQERGCRCSGSSSTRSSSTWAAAPTARREARLTAASAGRRSAGSTRSRPSAAPGPSASRRAQSARRSRQKSRTARSTTRGSAPGRSAGGPRVVGHAHLHHAAPRRAQLDEQLRGQEGAARFQSDALQRLAPEQLAGAVDVAQPEAEEQAAGTPGRCARRPAGWPGRRA